MLKIEHFEPVSTSIIGDVATFFLNEQAFHISHEGVLYDFVPMETNSIKVNLRNKQYLHTHEVLTFKHQNAYIRMTLYSFVLNSNLGMIINPIIEHNIINYLFAPKQVEVVKISQETEQMVKQLEMAMLTNAIDNALIEGDEAKFMSLTDKLTELQNEDVETKDVT